MQTSGTGALANGLAVTAPQGLPRRHRRSDPVTAGADLEAAGQLLDEAGWVMGIGRRAREGRRAADDPRLLRHVDRELAAVDGAGHGAVAGARRRRAAARRRRGPVQHASPSRSRAWDVFLAALNLDVPSLAVPFVSGAQPPDGVNFSAVVNPEYDALVAEASALTGAEACAVWNAAEEALYAQMNILPFAATTVPIVRQRRRVRPRPARDHRHQPSSRGGLAHRRRARPESRSAAGDPRSHGTGPARTAWGSRHPWPAFLIRRLARLVASLFLLVTISFAMIHAIPGDPVRTALGGITAQPELVAARRHDLGLDQPLARAVRRLPAGTPSPVTSVSSIITGQPVSDIIATGCRAPCGSSGWRSSSRSSSPTRSGWGWRS